MIKKDAMNIYLTDLKNERFAIHAVYSKELHEEVKKVEKRIWNADYLYWSMPLSAKEASICQVCPKSFVPFSHQ